MRVLCGILLYVLSIAAWSAAAAEEIDPCPRVAEGASSAERLVFWPWRIGDDEGDTQIRRAYPEDSWMFTTRPGVFWNVSCDDAGFEEQEFFPIGVVVKPFAPLIIPGFEEATGSRPILVLTEYGQRKVAREDDLALIAENATYVFADGIAEARACRSEDGCPGNSPSVCDQKRCSRGDEVAPLYGYALVDTRSPRTRSILAAYEMVFPHSTGENAGRSWSPERIRRAGEVSDLACVPVPVRAYKPGGTWTGTRGRHLSLCAMRRASGASANGITPFKIVTQDYARRAFSLTSDSSFHRRYGLSNELREAIGAALGSYQLTRPKECGETIESEGSALLSSGISVGLQSGFLDLEAGASSEFTLTVTRTWGADEFLFMSTYFLDEEANGAGNDLENELSLFRIAFRSFCERSRPAESTSVLIFNSSFSGGVLEIDTSDDLRQAFLERVGDDAYAFTPLTDTSALRQGHFWRIKDHHGYFFWRDTLRHYLEHENSVTRDLIRRSPPEERPFVRDFLAFLLLAAAYQHSVPG